MCEHLLMASRKMLKDISQMCIEIVFFGSLTPWGYTMPIGAEFTFSSFPLSSLSTLKV